MIVHSFVNVIPLINNTPGQVSPIGELSPNSASFSREIGNYSSSQFKDVKILTFQSENNDVQMALPLGMRNAILEMAQWIYDTSKDGSYTGDNSDFKQLFQVQYSDLEIEEVGRMEKVGDVWYPTYIVFSADGDLVSLWFSDQEFDKEYPEYELFPIMPLDDLDKLHETRANVFNTLDNISLTDIFNRIDIVRNEVPFTHQYPLEVDWVDKNDPEVTHKITFTALIYGNAGKNIDLIKNSLVEHILANSEYPRSEWEKILPELFLPNEFYISPMWNEISVENLQSIFGIYSPTADMELMFKYGFSTFHGLDIDYVYNNLEHSAFTFKSIGFVAIGNEKNQTGITRFRDQMPEFASVSTLDAYYDRLSPYTRGFMQQLTSAFYYAERWDGDGYVNLPNDFSTVERGDNTYIVFNYEKVNYLISVRSNVIIEPPIPEFPGDGDDDGPVIGPGPGDGFIGLPEIECSFGSDKYDTNSLVVRLVKFNPETGNMDAYFFDGPIYWYAHLTQIGEPTAVETAFSSGSDAAFMFAEYSIPYNGYEVVVTARLGDYVSNHGTFAGTFADRRNDGGNDPNDGILH